MIATIKGIVIEISKNYIVLESNGVGYLIYINPNFISKIGLNQKLFIYIKQLFKEDDISLYGFESFEQKIWFEYLIKVDGVGAKSALSILNIFSIKEIENAILNKDEKFFTSISGIGSKIATRIINEMQKIPSKINLDKSFTMSATEGKTKVKLESSIDLFNEENITAKDKGKKNKNSSQEKEEVEVNQNNNDYQKIIQEAMQAISKLGLSGGNLYRDIRFILNEIEESYEQKLKNSEISKYEISSEEIVSAFLKKMK